jgi:hypothetical protein
MFAKVRRLALFKVSPITFARTKLPLVRMKINEGVSTFEANNNFRHYYAVVMFDVQK